VLTFYNILFIKKGNRNKADNYRPISLTSQICKIIESIIRDTAVKHLEDNLLISDSQHGFRRGRSCLTNLRTFLDKVTCYVDTGNDVDVVFLDFAKAFDKVRAMRLLQKLKSHGIKGKLLRWTTGCQVELGEFVLMECYLTGRWF